MFDSPQSISFIGYTTTVHFTHSQQNEVDKRPAVMQYLNEQFDNANFTVWPHGDLSPSEWLANGGIIVLPDPWGPTNVNPPQIITFAWWEEYSNSLNMVNTSVVLA